MTDQTGNFGLLTAHAPKPFNGNLSSAIHVPGIGIGASRDAIRWATIGMLDELSHQYKSMTPIGRPASDFMNKVSNRRAFMLWALVNKNPISPNLKLASNRELIDIMILLRGFEPCIKDYFPNTTDNLEPSVSRGRTALNIGQMWQSEVCEKVYEDLFAND